MEAPKPRQTHWVRWTVIGVITLIVIVAVIAALGSGGSTASGSSSQPPQGNAPAAVAPTTQPTATSSSVATQAGQPAVAPTPVPPTPTPVPPTPTPVPPTPTPTTPVITASQRQYLSHLQGQTATMLSSSQRLSTLMHQVSSSPYLLYSASWRAAVYAECDIWQQTYEDAKTVVPPAGVEIIHAKWVEAMGHYNLAAEYLRRGISSQSSSLIDQAVAEIQAGTTSTNAAESLVRDFINQH